MLISVQDDRSQQTQAQIHDAMQSAITKNGPPGTLDKNRPPGTLDKKRNLFRSSSSSRRPLERCEDACWKDAVTPLERCEDALWNDAVTILERCEDALWKDAVGR